MKTFFKNNWFKLAVLILLLMCYVRLGKVVDNTFLTADIVDSGMTNINNQISDIHSSINDLRIDLNSR